MSVKSCLKYLIFVFNFIFFLMGCAILGLGIWLKVEKSDYIDISKYDYLTAANIAIAAGAIILVVSFLGCCGAIKEVAPMLMAFFILLVIIFLLEVAAGVFAYVKRGELEDELHADLKNAIYSKYSKKGEEGITTAIDKFQDKFVCCGFDGYSDWYKSTYYMSQSSVNKKLPKSCCKKVLPNGKTCPTSNKNDDDVVNNVKGCYSELKEFLKDNFLIIGSSAIVFAVIQILGMVLSMILYCSIQKKGYVV